MIHKENIKIKLEKEIEINENFVKILKDISLQIISYGNKVLNRRLITFLKEENTNKNIFFSLDDGWLIIHYRNNYSLKISVQIISEENKRINVQQTCIEIENKISRIDKEVENLKANLQNLDSICEEHNKIIYETINFRNKISRHIIGFFLVLEYKYLTEYNYII